MSPTVTASAMPPRPQPNGWLECVAGFLDGARLRVLRRLGTRARPWVRSRALRVGLAGVLALFGGLAAVLYAPFVLALAGPLLLGVPHVVGDARYLGVRADLHRHRAVALVIGLGTLGAAFYGTRAGAVATVALAGVAEGPRALRAGLALLGAGAAVFALDAPKAADSLFAHVHHLVSLGILFAWGGAGRARFGLALAVLAVVAWLASGLLDAPLASGFATTATPLEPARLVRSLALGLDGPPALRLAAIFLVLQSFHYAIWLRLVPELDRPRAGPRSFRASLAALEHDLTPRGVRVVAVLALAVPLVALADPAWIRARYLALTSFHGHFEWLAAAWLALSARARTDGVGQA